MDSDVLVEMESLDQLLDLLDDPRIDLHRLANNLTEAGMSNILCLCGALWTHSGNALQAHAELTSGKCSNGFINVLEAVSYPEISDLMAMALANTVAEFLSSTGLPGWVVGSDHAAAVFSQNVARHLKARHDFTQKKDDRQVWNRFHIEPGNIVLQVEELVTTKKTLHAVRDGVSEGNPSPVTFAPCVATLVNRSRFTRFEGVPILSLVTYRKFKTWEPEECPLCARGSKRLRPKQHWEELNTVP